MTEDFNLLYERHTATLRKAFDHNKSVVFDALAAANITTVTVEFDGEGDSGGITSIGALKDDESVGFPKITVPYQEVGWNEDTLHATEHPLKEAIEHLCYQLLEQTNGGWENNEGAFGTFELTVADLRIALEFNARFTDVSTDTHEF
jgi:hypothetical protein